MSVSGTGDKFRIYVSSSVPQEGFAVTGYNPSQTLAANTFYFITDLPNNSGVNSTSFTAPSPAGTYYIVVNAENADGSGCDWSGKAYQRSSSGGITYTGTCSVPNPPYKTLVLGSTTNLYACSSIGKQACATGRCCTFGTYCTAGCVDAPVVSSPTPTPTSTQSGSTSTSDAYACSLIGKQACATGRCCSFGTYCTAGCVDAPDISSPTPSPTRVITSPSPTRSTSPTVSMSPTMTVNPSQIVNPTPTGDWICQMFHLFCSSTTPSPTLTIVPSTSVATGSSPTITSGPNTHTFILSVKMPGIGLAPGDNTHPLHSTLPATVQFFDQNNNKVLEITPQITYLPSTGVFASSTPVNLNDGYVYMKIKVATSLVRRAPGVIHIQQGQGIVIPPLAVVFGDLNGNNVMDISDYQAFLSCYGDKTCSQKTQADFNDDGVIDIVDYNILLRSYAIHEGD